MGPSLLMRPMKTSQHKLDTTGHPRSLVLFDARVLIVLQLLMLDWSKYTCATPSLVSSSSTWVCQIVVGMVTVMVGHTLQDHALSGRGSCRSHEWLQELGIEMFLKTIGSVSHPEKLKFCFRALLRHPQVVEAQAGKQR